VKLSRTQIHSRVYRIPEICFEDQRLTSFAGLVVFQAFFSQLRLKSRLKQCFEHIRTQSVVGFHMVSFILIVHLIIGYRKLREIDRYRDDPMVCRVLGLRRLPSVSTISRTLKEADAQSVQKQRQLIRGMVLERLQDLQPYRITLDFDGSVLGTGRSAEGTGVGFNKNKKGQRSYYPLFCTVAQSGQVLDLYHRPGNVHDSNGAKEFIESCIGAVRGVLPRGAVIEARLDSAFFGDEIVRLLDEQGVEFTISVPFERFPQLKAMIETRKRWRWFDGVWSYFKTRWSPKSWKREYGFFFLRQKVKKQDKAVVQFDLFIPHVYGYEFKVVITNKRCSTRKVLRFHNGRGAQENIFAELKSQCQIDYIPVRGLVGNQLYLIAAILAHNLFREMHMKTFGRCRRTTEKRSPLWEFCEAQTVRQHLIQRAGRLTRPQGRLRLTMSGNEATRQTVLQYLNVLTMCA